METFGSRQVYANPWMTVREDTACRADGSTDVHGVVEAQDIALVIPAEGDREPGEQDMRSAWFSRAGLERMIGDGALTDSKSIAAYALLLTQRASGVTS